jgi:NAD-dependent dihydropyrimidine dehydrogenase PreA subunit
MIQKIIRKEVSIPKEPKVPETIEELCIGCNVCIKVCPVKDVNTLVKEPLLEGVFSVIAEIPLLKRGVRVSIAPSGTCTLPEFCIKCRKCVEECPADARTF